MLTSESEHLYVELQDESRVFRCLLGCSGRLKKIGIMCLEKEHNTISKVFYVGEAARSLLWLPPMNVVNKYWSLGARSGNIIEEKRVPIQETVTHV